MGREVHIAVLILLSIFEVWMCYQVLYRTVLDKKYMRTWQKVLIWANILGVGMLLGVNRSMVYFSHTMFVLEIIIATLIVSISNVKKWYLNLEVVTIYSSLIAILDFFFAFCGLIFLDNFWFTIYLYGDSLWKWIMFLITRIIMAVILFIFSKFERIDKIIEGTQKLLIPATVVLLIIIRLYQYVIYDIMNGLTDMKEWGAACSLIAVTAVVSFCVTVCWKNQSLKNEKQILEIREKMELKNLEDMGRVLEENRIHVHDIRHHLIILKEYVSRKEYEAVASYLDEVMAEYVERKEGNWTRIRSLDVLLSEKTREAEREDIQFRIEADVLKRVPFKETETSVLFGNLLDNAIEACKKIQDGSKEIRVEIRQKKNFLFITITNTICQLPKEKKGKLLSDKNNRDIHGYGLKSVERIVKNYEGSFQYEVMDGRFKVLLYFTNEQKEKR